MPRILYSISPMLALDLYSAVHLEALLVLKSCFILLISCIRGLGMFCKALHFTILSSDNPQVRYDPKDNKIKKCCCQAYSNSLISIRHMVCSYLHFRRYNMHLFQMVDPIGRMTYVVNPSIAIGTVVSTIAIHT